VGLRLSARIEELFDVEVTPIIDAARTLEERVALQDGWQIVRCRGERYRYFARGKITLGKERVVSMLRRQLRGLELIAVGQVEFLGERQPLKVIAPDRWEDLIVTWASDTVTDDHAVISAVHVAKVDRLGESQRQELDGLLYKMGGELVAEAEKVNGTGGRPARQRKMVEAWIDEKRASGSLPTREEAARAQAIQHFEAQIAAKVISDETIRRIIKGFYSREPSPPRPQ
jgi:hypothetical protein